MDEELCACGHKKEEHLDGEACQVEGCACAGYQAPEPPADKNTLPPPGIFGGVTRPGGTGTR